MFATRLNEAISGWRGVCLVAVTYVYFLIFAQFAFLKRLDQLGFADAHLSFVMGAMGLGGIAFSLLASISRLEAWSRVRLQVAFVSCGAAAALTLLPLNLTSSIAVAFLIGSALGTLTVTLVANLRLWIGGRNPVWKVGIGTGLGYFACNVPALFNATPRWQAIVAALLCLLGVIAASRTVSTGTISETVSSDESPTFGFVLIGFTALVWLDSAAFFIIQNTPSLKAGTWEGTLHLWTNGVIHLGAALTSAYLLRYRGLRFVLGSAVIMLAVACLLLHQPGGVVLASLFYPAGVSLYSVALVAYPSLLARAGSTHQRALRAGLIYAVAGWFGSAMGIGMGQHLRQVPIPFVVVAALLILGPALLLSRREHRQAIALVGIALAISSCVYLVSSGEPIKQQHATSAEERGRQVYIGEGCINCHSQYVRPGSADVLMWGPTQTIDELRSQHPPLIGNRRQGPDLSQVGGRRSPLWLKAHFFDPRAVSHTSFMPSYAYLFNNSARGDDLVLYLVSLKSPKYAEHVSLEQRWEPSQSSLEAASPEQGAHLYDDHCATCHESYGATRTVWGPQFKRVPPNLRTGPWNYVHPSASTHDRVLRIARIIKFGIPGTDMPGHEYLSDKEVSSIALLLDQTMIMPHQVETIDNKTGENP